MIMIRSPGKEFFDLVELYFGDGVEITDSSVMILEGETWDSCW